jgi:PAS domain S-box-containing protein
LHACDHGFMVTRAVIETDTEGIIRRWSKAAETLFGHSADQALGRPVDLLVPEHLRNAHWAGFHRAMQELKVKDLANARTLMK